MNTNKYLTVQVRKCSCTPAEVAIQKSQLLEPNPWSQLATTVWKQTTGDGIPNIHTGILLDHLLRGVFQATIEILFDPSIRSARWAVLSTSSGALPISPLICSRHPVDSESRHTGSPWIGSARIIETSWRVMVISPVGRWKLCVSGLQRSTSAVMWAAFK